MKKEICLLFEHLDVLPVQLCFLDNLRLDYFLGMWVMYLDGAEAVRFLVNGLEDMGVGPRGEQFLEDEILLELHEVDVVLLIGPLHCAALTNFYFLAEYKR